MPGLGHLVVCQLESWRLSSCQVQEKRLFRATTQGGADPAWSLEEVKCEAAMVNTSARSDIACLAFPPGGPPHA